MKRLLAALLCLALAGAACSDDGDEPAATTTVPGPESTTTASTDDGGTGDADDSTGTDPTASRRLFVSVMTDAGLAETEAECLADRFLAGGTGDLEDLAGLQDDPAEVLDALEECGVTLADLDALAEAFAFGAFDGSGDGEEGDGEEGDGDAGDGDAGDGDAGDGDAGDGDAGDTAAGDATGDGSGGTDTGDGEDLGLAESTFVDAFVDSLSERPQIDEDQARCLAVTLLEEGGGLQGASELAADIASLQGLLERCGLTLDDLTG